MRRFFSLSTVFLTLFCIANIFFPLGNLSVLFSAFTLIFALILYKLSKTDFKRKLPKILIIINIAAAIIFFLKPVIFKDKVKLEATVEEQRKELKQDALDELNDLDREGILDAVDTADKSKSQNTNEEKQDSLPPKIQAPPADEIQFEQPAFN